MAESLTIEAANLRKSYGSVEAVSGLDLEVPRGSIHGFLGRNGAGKTTTIKILLGMARPAGGQARVFGLPADKPGASVAIRSRTGFVSEEKELYDYMTVEEMIRFTAAFYPRWRGDLEQRYLRRFELPAERRVKTLSRGMRAKLALLLALCPGAELLILDEPTAGLDPAVTEEVLKALVVHVAAEEMTVFFSSHQIAEVEQIAEGVTIIDRGRTMVAGALEDLRENYRRIQLVFGREAPRPEDTPAFRGPGIMRIERDGRALTLLASAGADQIVAEARAWQAVSVDVMPVTLKEIFLETIREEA
jgi:ABC-2 type transport system ATP-binding protein